MKICRQIKLFVLSRNLFHYVCVQADRCLQIMIDRALRNWGDVLHAT